MACRAGILGRRARWCRAGASSRRSPSGMFCSSIVAQGQAAEAGRRDRYMCAARNRGSRAARRFRRVPSRPPTAGGRPYTWPSLPLGARPRDQLMASCASCRVAYTKGVAWSAAVNLGRSRRLCGPGGRQVDPEALPGLVLEPYPPTS